MNSNPTVKGTCRGCSWWRPDNPAQPVWGDCLATAYDGALSDRIQTGCGDCMGSPISTRQDFGCVQFEAREDGP